MTWAQTKEAVRGGAPPHKNNLIGTAAGGVLKSVCLKLITSSKFSPFILVLQLDCSLTNWKLRSCWSLALNIGLRKIAKRTQDFVNL